MLQGRAGPAPSTSRPCRISTQCHGAMQDPQMKLWGHAGPAFATARPRRACNQRCRAMQHLPPGLWGCAEPTASAVDPCRTHSRWHAALQDLQQCCRAVQDPQCPPCLTQDAHGRASPTDGVVGPRRLRQQQAGPVPAAAVPSCAILCHLAPGASRSPEPGASALLPRHLRSPAKPGPAVPPPRPPVPAQLPVPPAPRGAPKPPVAPGGRGGGGPSAAPVGPSTSERRGSLPLASTPQRARPRSPHLSQLERRQRRARP